MGVIPAGIRRQCATPFLLALVAALLAACAPTAPEVPVAPVAPRGPDDQGEFARRRIAPEQVSATVMRRIPAAPAAPPANVVPMAWRNLTVVVDTTSVESTGQTENSSMALRFVNLGNGLVQRAAQLARYDIDYGTTYSLMWRGLVDIKRQEVVPRTAVARPVIEIKSVARFDAMPTDLAREFRMDYSTGIENQSTGFLPVDLTCRTARRMPAANVHARMQGDALEIECRLRADNAVQSASRWVMLLSYGVAIEMFEQRGRTAITHRVRDFAARS